MFVSIFGHYLRQNYYRHYATFRALQYPNLQRGGYGTEHIRAARYHNGLQMTLQSQLTTRSQAVARIAEHIASLQTM